MSPMMTAVDCEWRRQAWPVILLLSDIPVVVNKHENVVQSVPPLC